MINKKGQEYNINTLISVGIMIVIIGIVLGVSSQILDNLRKTTDKSETVAITDEALTAVADGYVKTVHEPFTTSTLKVMNNSNGREIFAGTGAFLNWSSHTNYGLNFSKSGNNATSSLSLKINYSYDRNKPDAAHNITSDANTGLLTFGSYLPLLAIILVAAVIIGLVIVYFKRFE